MFDDLRTTRRANDPDVGDRFVLSDERKYTQDGRQAVHRTEVLYMVTALTDNGFKAQALEVLKESDRPSFAGDPAGTSMAWFGWDNAVRQGRARLVEGV